MCFLPITAYFQRWSPFCFQICLITYTCFYFIEIASMLVLSRPPCLHYIWSKMLLSIFLQEQSKWDHVSPVLASLHCTFWRLFLSFKALNWWAPSYFADCLITYSPPASLRRADQQFLMFAKTRLKNRKDLALIVAPKLWIKLSLHVRMAPSLVLFESLKIHFHSLDFNPVQELHALSSIYLILYFFLMYI